MKIQKLKLEDFRQREELQELLDVECEEKQQHHEQKESSFVQEFAESSDTMAMKPCNSEDEALLLQKRMLEQTELLEKSLNEIKCMIANIEMQQSSNIDALSTKAVLFLKSVMNKSLGLPSLRHAIIEPTMEHLSHVLQSLKDEQKININIPSEMNSSVKESLMKMLKGIASRLNIEVLEHNDNAISVEWDGGKAEFTPEKPLEAIQEQLEKFEA